VAPSEVLLIYVTPRSAQLKDLNYKGQSIRTITESFSTGAAPPPQTDSRLLGSWQHKGDDGALTLKFAADGAYSSRSSAPGHPEKVASGAWASTSAGDKVSVTIKLTTPEATSSTEQFELLPSGQIRWRGFTLTRDASQP
jgi:hypothetical protein